MKKQDLDIARQLFGMKLVSGGNPNGLIQLFIEDDENWNPKCEFNHIWLDDLIACATAMRERIRSGK